MNTRERSNVIELPLERSKRSNVIAFPLERSRERAPARRVLHLRDGKIVSAPAPAATTAILHERLERIEDRRPPHI
jgi:hypothetical protein